MQNVLDLSINEISVHYLGHSQVIKSFYFSFNKWTIQINIFLSFSQLDVEEPFLNLEEKFLKDTE